MASEHSNENIQDLYEGDQSKLYSGILNHHHKDINSDKSKAQVKRIVKVMIYLAIVTSVEVALGLWEHNQSIISHGVLSAVFLSLTLLKAYLIVDVFMHLGNEFRNFVMMVLIPLILLGWGIVAFLSDGHSWLHDNNTRPYTEQVIKTAEQPK